MNETQILDALKALQQETERAASEIARLKVNVDFHLHHSDTDKEIRFSLAREAALRGWTDHQSPSVPDICWVTDGENMSIFIDAEQYEKLKESLATQEQTDE